MQFPTLREEKLRKEEGWKYLLDFFAKEKVDLLGDAFNEFFVKRSIYRKDGEEFVGYEPPFKMLIRKLEKALKEPGSQGQIPSELFGWYLLNSYMRMEPSDVANVRERAESYKLDHVISRFAEDVERRRSCGQRSRVQDEEEEEECGISCSAMRRRRRCWPLSSLRQQPRTKML